MWNLIIGLITSWDKVEKELIKQFERAKKLGWLSSFTEAARLYNFETALLIAIASRETDLDPKYLKEPGDNGNGYGLMQIDKRSYPEWVSKGLWKNNFECIGKGAQVLNEKRVAIKRSRGNKLTLTDSKGNIVTFAACDYDDEQATLLAIAAYNVGLWAVYHYCKSGNPDKTTTGGNYSKDVIERAIVFRKLLNKE